MYSLRNLIVVSDNHDKIFRTIKLEGITARSHVFVTLQVFIELRVNLGLLAYTTYERQEVRGRREEQVRNTSGRSKTVDGFSNTGLKVVRHVHVEAINVIDEAHTRGHAIADNTFPLGVIRHVDNVSLRSKLEFHG